MFSTMSSNVASRRAAVFSKAYRLTTTMSISGIPCSSTAFRCPALPRIARMPPAIKGCSVLTRPSSISGKPVSSDTSRTVSPCSRSRRAVPPVDTISTESSANRRAKSATPVLSVTLIRARRIFGIESPSVKELILPSHPPFLQNVGSSSSPFAASLRRPRRASRNTNHVLSSHHETRPYAELGELCR